MTSGEDESALREGWARRAGEYVGGCGCRSRQHRAMWGAWASIGGLLAIIGVGGAALASASLFASAAEGSTLATLGAWLGALAAVAAALNAWVAPQATAHKKARDGFASLVSRFDDFHRITSPGERFAAVRAEWEMLRSQREELQAASPEPAAWAKWLIGRRNPHCKED